MSLSSLRQLPFCTTKKRQATPHVWPGGGDLGRCLEGGWSQVFRVRQVFASLKKQFSFPSLRKPGERTGGKSAKQ